MADSAIQELRATFELDVLPLRRIRMPDTRCLIIDDISETLASMSELGRQVATPALEAVRAEVIAFAARRGWTVLRHRAFAEWAAPVLDREAHSWLILDPLFVGPTDSPRVRRIRISRNYDRDGAIVSRRYTGSLDVPLNPLSTDVGLVDDAAASGMTLEQVARSVRSAGGRVVHILVCASSREARDAVRARLPVLRWSEFVRGDWSVIHLRDGCPYALSSGRPAGHPLVVGADGGAVDVRVAASSILGSYWQVMRLDTRVRVAMEAARTTIDRNLSASLRRPALVGDLCLLGSGTTVQIAHDHVLVGDETLDDLTGRTA